MARMTRADRRHKLGQAARLVAEVRDNAHLELDMLAIGDCSPPSVALAERLSIVLGILGDYVDVDAPEKPDDAYPSETARKLVERLVRKSEKVGQMYADTGEALDRDNAKAALLEYIGELEAGDDEPTPIELTEEEWEAAVEWAPEGAARRMVRNVTLTAIDAINEMREQL